MKMVQSIPSMEWNTLERYKVYLVSNYTSTSCCSFVTSVQQLLRLQRKQPPRGVPKKRYSENMRQIYRRTPMPKCDFKKKLEHLWVAASLTVNTNLKMKRQRCFLCISHVMYVYNICIYNMIMRI